MMNLRQELEAHHNASFGWAMACCQGRQREAEDILQTSYLKVLDGRARFDRRSAFRTWMFGVIRRTAHETQRRQWLHGLLLERWVASEPVASPLTVFEAANAGWEQREPLQRALLQLSRRQQQVLHLVFYQDCTVEESASALDISVGSARTHFERGKHRLRALLREDQSHE